MKPETKEVKNERLRYIIRAKAIEESTKTLDKYFPKGNKKRGEAMALFAVCFNEGFDAGVKYMERKQ